MKTEESLKIGNKRRENKNRPSFFKESCGYILPPLSNFSNKKTAKFKHSNYVKTYSIKEITCCTIIISCAIYSVLFTWLRAFATSTFICKVSNLLNSRAQFELSCTKQWNAPVVNSTLFRYIAGIEWIFCRYGVRGTVQYMYSMQTSTENCR